MKPLKTITTALLLLVTVTAFAQTKEETIYWLKTYGKFNGVLVNDEGGEILKDRWYYYTTINKDNSGFIKERFDRNGHKYDVETLNFSDLQYAYIDQCKRDYNESTFIFILSKSVSKITAISSFTHNGTSRGISIQFRADIDKEELQSIEKALIHLAELYGAKPAPKVDKNTF